MNYNQVMTGEEKINAVISLINSELSKLIRGRVISLDSSQIENIGIDLNEQAIVLEVLAQEYKCITYKTNIPFKNERDFSPTDLLDITEISMQGMNTLESVKSGYFDMREYDIEVKPEFVNLVQTIDEDNVSTTATREYAEISLDKAKRVLRISYGGLSRNLKHFKSAKNANYVFMSNLLLRPNETLDRNELGLTKQRSRVKDLPKTAGFDGPLKAIFFDIDSKHQTINFHNKKNLSSVEAEIVSSYVNSKS